MTNTRALRALGLIIALGCVLRLCYEWWATG
jgi:hypothetical protein